MDYKNKTFDVKKFPEKIEEKAAKAILDALYKTVKNEKSNSDQKNIAIWILKSIIIETKNTTLINLFLICQLWKFFCK